MTSAEDITQSEIESLYQKLKKEAADGGYFLNPEESFTKDLVRSLLINKKRYGYMVCPCRLADGEKEKDLDMICPCDYRDEDLEEYGACFCGLYVSKDIADGKKRAVSIPERRGTVKKNPVSGTAMANLSYPVWRCKVCGYLCARNEPPGICPVCKVTKERFERFI